GSAIDHPVRDGRVAVDAAVAQEGPVAANVFELAQVDFGREDFFLIVRALRKNAAEGIGDKRSSPEFKTVARLRLVSAHVAGFKSDAVDDSDIHAVGYGVGAINCTPGIV